VATRDRVVQGATVGIKNRIVALQNYCTGELLHGGGGVWYEYIHFLFLTLENKHESAFESQADGTPSRVHPD
jgi:hypothetical protein